MFKTMNLFLFVYHFCEEISKFLSSFAPWHQASPEHASRAQQKEFQTEMLKILMDHLLAADVLLGEQAALPIMTGNSYSNLATSVFYFASRVVDKMWHGENIFVTFILFLSSQLSLWWIHFSFYWKWLQIPQLHSAKYLMGRQTWKVWLIPGVELSSWCHKMCSGLIHNMCFCPKQTLFTLIEVFQDF